MNLSSKILVSFGFIFLLFGGYLVEQRYSSEKLEFKDLKVGRIINSNITPIRVIIPSLNIDNGIYAARINSGKWEVTNKGVSYLVSSVIPGNRGNSILYGHNWPSLLGNLPKIKPGQEIEIILSNGDNKKFVVKYTSVVSFDKSYILTPSSDIRLTIYTCTGFLDSKRFVATAVLSGLP